MGMTLVSLVLNKWAPILADRPFRVLMRMAMTAYDEDTKDTEACMFFGGHDFLATVMHVDGKGSEETVNKAIQRAVKDLIQLGAIERVNGAHRGQKSSYRLTLRDLDKIDAGRSNLSRKGDTRVRHMGDTSVPERGTPVSRKGDTRVPPRRQENKLEKPNPEAGADLLLPVTLARATQEGEKEMEKKCDDPECILGYVYDPSKPKGERNMPCPVCRPPFTHPLEKKKPS